MSKMVWLMFFSSGKTVRQKRWTGSCTCTGAEDRLLKTRQCYSCEENKIVLLHRSYTKLMLSTYRKRA